MNFKDVEVQMKLLQIDSSARTSSVTRRLTAKFAAQWRENHPDGEVIRRDLSVTALPVITDAWAATQIEDSKRTAAERSYLATSDELIEELQAADTVVIGAPMYNSPSLRRLKRGSIRLCGSARRSPMGRTARKAFSQKRKLS